MFAIQCPNAGCRKLTNPLLREEDDKIVCEDCGGLMNNVNPFVKSQLKFYGQVVKPTKKGKAFSVFCKDCKLQDVPVLKNDKVHCVKCDKILNVSPHFANLLKLKS